MSRYCARTSAAGRRMTSDAVISIVSSLMVPSRTVVSLRDRSRHPGTVPSVGRLAGVVALLELAVRAQHLDPCATGLAAKQQLLDEDGRSVREAFVQPVETIARKADEVGVARKRAVRRI